MPTPTISKNTTVGLSLGSIALIVVTSWTMLGIGRPLFASDLHKIEQKMDTYQTQTAIQILTLRKGALEAELRAAKRDLHANPNDQHARADVFEIETEIDDIEAKIACHRTKGCSVENGT